MLFRSAETMKQLSEVFKKDPAISLTGSEEETALTTIEGIINKQVKIQKPIRNPLASYSKLPETEHKSPKDNNVKVISKEMFQEKFKNIRENYILKVEGSNTKSINKVPNQPADSRKEIKIEESNLAKNLIVEEKKPPSKTKFTQEPEEPKIIPKPTEQNNKRISSIPEQPRSNNSIREPNQKLLSSNSETPMTTEVKKRSQHYSCNKDKPRFNRGIIGNPLIFSVAKPETTSYWNRPTLSLFHNMIFNPGTPHAPELMSDRPTSAVVREIGNFQGTEKKPNEINTNKNINKNNEEKLPLWKRPQSAMPLGKPIVLPTIAKSVYKPYCYYSSRIRVNNDPIMPERDIKSAINSERQIIVAKSPTNVHLKTLVKRLTINDLDIFI